MVWLLLLVVCGVVKVALLRGDDDDDTRLFELVESFKRHSLDEQSSAGVVERERGGGSPNHRTLTHASYIDVCDDVPTTAHIHIRTAHHTLCALIFLLCVR